jgi:hypothetical protein
MKILTMAVGLFLVVAACGGSLNTSDFDQANADEFFEWCVENRVDSASDSWQCGEIADLLLIEINEKGLEADCVTRLVKRTIITPPEPTKFTSGRNDWTRHPLPYDLNVSIGIECKAAKNPSDTLEDPIDFAEAVACSDLSLKERMAGVRVGKYYEVQAFILINPEIAPGALNLHMSRATDSAFFAGQLEEAVDSLCPNQSSVVEEFTNWLISLQPDQPPLSAAPVATTAAQ